jgi:hypothetical protein
MQAHVYGSELLQSTSTLMSPKKKTTFFGNILPQGIRKPQEKDAHIK